MQLTTFNFDAAAVRVILCESGDPWFVASDVCDVLTIGTEATRRLDDDEKGLRTVQTPGGDQQMTAINESGLYSLILTSRKPEAKRFKKWVTSEVLPSIRKTGAYAPGSTSASGQDPEVARLVALRAGGALSDFACEVAAFHLLGLVHPSEASANEPAPAAPAPESQPEEKLPYFLRVEYWQTRSGRRVKPRPKFRGNPKPVKLTDVGRELLRLDTEGLVIRTASALACCVVGGYFEVRRALYEFNVDTITGFVTASGVQFSAGRQSGGEQAWKAVKLLREISGVK